DELKRQRKIKDEYKRSYDEDKTGWNEIFDKMVGLAERDLNRVSKLEVLEVSRNSINKDKMDKKFYKWFMESGFDVRLLDESDMRSNNEEVYLDDDELDLNDDEQDLNDELDLNDYELDLDLNDFF
ncbi:hypothetical protein BGZ99_009370, partial [Dissophora globulifera]